jgi:predicted secreted protein
MAIVKAMNGTSLLVQIGDGATPTEVFAHDCLINTERGISFASETNRQVIPDCDAPDSLAWSVVNKDALSATISGAGMLHTASVEEWHDWFNSDDAKNVRVTLNGVSAANGGGHWAGAFKLTGWEITGNRNEKATVSVTLESDGPVAWVDAQS